MSAAKWAIRGTALLMVAAGVGYAAWVLKERERVTGISAVIVAPDDRLNGQPWLKPNLDHALVVTPDRPHDLDEVEAQREGTGDTIHRTRSYRLTTNSEGLRAPEIGPKRRGTTRIIALGDSVTHGWGVEDDETYPARLQALLRERGHDVEVINAGVPANVVPVMRDWCRRVAPDLEPDMLIWTRRPPHFGPTPAEDFVRALRSCQLETETQMVVVLPPISTYDLRGRAAWQDEEAALKRMLSVRKVPMIELTPIFRQAQEGRGDALVLTETEASVVNQETGEVLLTAPFDKKHMPREVYDLFEEDPEVREALFFDQGHPDAEGFELFARTVADAVEPLLDPPAE
jgi:hypothetical protein